MKAQDLLQGLTHIGTIISLQARLKVNPVTSMVSDNQRLESIAPQKYSEKVRVATDCFKGKDELRNPMICKFDFG